MPNRRKLEKEPVEPVSLPPSLETLRVLVDEHFTVLQQHLPLLQSLDWRSRGRALEEFDKRTAAIGLGRG